MIGDAEVMKGDGTAPGCGGGGASVRCVGAGGAIGVGYVLVGCGAPVGAG